jgi:hypothetical protein
LPVFPAAPLLHVSFLITASDSMACMPQFKPKKKADRQIGRESF